ncbi:helicase-like transcription factor CHR28 [Cornus florida]|uniref:helicase-like transcription factor CHR28 n=1 Tax=Cornus florida TaxID=4283 RepID=UPI002899E241|nr:helicase-like transcription factor CHR28 [Cornus florida]
MLMADDSSNIWSVDDLSAVDDLSDDIDLSMDIQSFLDILEESPDRSQSSPEGLSLENVQQGLPDLESAPSFVAEIPGSVTFSPSYNSEASDSRAGGSDGSFEPIGNSVLEFDYGKLIPSEEIGSPMHSYSPSLENWMGFGHSTPSSERDGASQNASSYSRCGGKEIKIEIHNCSTSYNFASRDANHVSDVRETSNLNHHNGETESKFRHLQGDTHSKYVSQDPLIENSYINYGQFCHTSENSLKASGAPDIVEPSTMDVDTSLHNAYYTPSNNCEIPDSIYEIGDHYSDFQYCRGEAFFAGPSRQYRPDSFSFQLLSNDDDEMMIHLKDEVGELSTQNACSNGMMILGTQVEREGETVAEAPGIDMSSVKQVVNVKDERSDEVVAPQNWVRQSGLSGDGFSADKGLRQSLPGFLHSFSTNKHASHVKDEKEGISLAASERTHQSLDTINGTEGRNSTPVSIGKQLGCTTEQRESKPTQLKSMESHLSKGSYRAIQSSVSYSSNDNDSDICILEDISEPAPSNISYGNGKSLVTSQRSNYSNPLHHVGVGGVRLKTNDERLIFRVALQDLSQPKSEASPPDGLLAVPLLRHQRIALSWMVQKETASFHCSGGILADDQGLGKTISTIALILKERSPSSRLCPSDMKQNGIETLNLDEDDDSASELDKSKQDTKSCQVMSNGSLMNCKNTPAQAKGRLAAGTLVVCPTSVLRQWAEELHSKVNSKANLSVLIYHGSNRTKDPSELTKYDVVLTTYSIVSMEVPKQPLVDKDDDETRNLEIHAVPSMGFSSSKKRKYPPSSDKRYKKGKDGGLLESVARPLARVGWFRVVLDEAQSIKNYRTQVARACWGLRAKRRWCLSGTPIQNAVDDLYSYFRFLRYDPYAVYKSFCSTIKVPINRNPANGYRKLQAVLKTIMLRRTKGTLLDGEPIVTLPPKSVELKKVDFTKEERDFYCRLEDDSRAQFAEYAAAGTVKQNYVNILLMLLRLRQACDHPLLVKGYDSSSAWKSSLKMARKLPREKLVCLLNCLEASLAICGICNDPPEDGVVTSCGHVFCNQCICEHLTGDDSQCPAPNCRAQISASSVFSRTTLRSSLSDQSDPDTIPDHSSSESTKRHEPCSASCAFDSSKIKAALEVLQSLSKPRDCKNSLKSMDESASCSENSSNLHVESSFRKTPDNETPILDNDLKDSIKVAGEKAIVFSQWTRMLDLLEACLKSSSIQYRRLDGTMSVMARDKAVKDFNTLPEVSVMIMSLKAASLGLNMVAACHVLLLDLWWNPTTEDQAIDRAHRIGQTRPVTVLRLTVKDTVEDRILALQQKKREMVASAFGEDETGSRQTRLTTEDLKYLFMV